MLTSPSWTCCAAGKLTLSRRGFEAPRRGNLRLYRGLNPTPIDAIGIEGASVIAGFVGLLSSGLVDDAADTSVFVLAEGCATVASTEAASPLGDDVTFSRLELPNHEESPLPMELTGRRVAEASGTEGEGVITTTGWAFECVSSGSGTEDSWTCGVGGGSSVVEGG